MSANTASTTYISLTNCINTEPVQLNLQCKTPSCTVQAFFNHIHHIVHILN